jgi:diketogulonate reductase-like aldo/keto reductase
MRVGVSGLGGAEIGFEEDRPEADARPLGEALDAGLDVIDTAEGYLGSEELNGRARRPRAGLDGRARRALPPDEGAPADRQAGSLPDAGADGHPRR